MRNDKILTSSMWEDDCPKPQDRIPRFNDWSCKEYTSFRRFQEALTLNIIIVKSIQIAIFGLLLLKLLWQSYKKKGTIGWTPILIALV